MPRSADRPSDGKYKAIVSAPDKVRRAVKEFNKLNSREARAAFADHWIGVWAQDFDYACQLRELLHQVDEDRLWSNPQRVGPLAPGDRSTHSDRESYASFEEYFEDRVGRQFSTWAELEDIYQYARTYKPDLFDKSLVAARAEALQGKTINSGRGPLTKAEKAIGDIVTNSETGKGNSAEYLTRRIARDHPDIFERLKAGEYRSTRAAALEAGIIHPTATIRTDDAESIAATLRRQLKPAVLQQLTELLTKDTLW